MADVIGPRSGARVRVKAKGPNAAFDGKVLSVIVPKIGWRFAVVEDAHGATHACDLRDIETIPAHR